MTKEEMVKACCGRYGLCGDDGILKEHNQRIYSKIIQGLEKSNKVQIEQATGIT